MAIPITASLSAIPNDQDMKRKPNFTDFEKNFLIAQYELYKPILSSKLCDSSTNREKTKIWNMVTAALNAGNPMVERTPKDVKKKWENLVTQSRKELSDFRQNQGLSYVAPLTVQTLKVLELLDDITLQQNAAVEENKGNGGENEEFQTEEAIPVVKEELFDIVQNAPIIEQIRYVPTDKETTDSSISSIQDETSPQPPHSSSVSSNSGRKRPFDNSYTFHDQDPDQDRSRTCNCNRQETDFIMDDPATIRRDIRKLKRLKIKLETEKLMLEKQKLEMEIRRLAKDLDN